MWSAKDIHPLGREADKRIWSQCKNCINGRSQFGVPNCKLEPYRSWRERPGIIYWLKMGGWGTCPKFQNFRIKEKS
jgi:hypothetical protein